MTDISDCCVQDAHTQCLGVTETSRLCGCTCHWKCGCGAELLAEKEVFTGECAACFDATAPRREV